MSYAEQVLAVMIVFTVVFAGAAAVVDIYRSRR